MKIKNTVYFILLISALNTSITSIAKPLDADGDGEITVGDLWKVQDKISSFVGSDDPVDQSILKYLKK